MYIEKLRVLWGGYGNIKERNRVTCLTVISYQRARESSDRSDAIGTELA
jgi:hypothetical protein